VAVFEGESGPDLAAAAERFGVDIPVLEAVEASASPGAVRGVPLPNGRFGWVVGVGSGRPDQWRTAGAALARAVHERLGDSDDGETEFGDLGEASEWDYLQVQLPAEASSGLVSSLTLGLALGGYRFRVTAKPVPPRLRKVLLVPASEGAEDELREQVRLSREWAAATALARDLANAPSNVKDPAWLAGTAAELAGSVPGLKATVRNEKWLAEHGFGGILAVGGGSSRPPALLELSYQPENAEGPHLVLVGKGITFDTGGISLKPADGMHLMRTDMSGGAAVIGALLSIARLELPIRVT